MPDINKLLPLIRAVQVTVERVQDAKERAANLLTVLKLAEYEVEKAVKDLVEATKNLKE